MAEAPSLQTDFEAFGARGFIPVTLLAENDAGSAPSLDELNEWVSEFGLTHPVVSDSGWVVGNTYEDDFGIPSMTLIAPGGVIKIRDSIVGEAQIEEVLQEYGR